MSWIMADESQLIVLVTLTGLQQSLLMSRLVFIMDYGMY